MGFGVLWVPCETQLSRYGKPSRVTRDICLRPAESRRRACQSSVLCSYQPNGTRQGSHNSLFARGPPCWTLAGVQNQGCRTFPHWPEGQPLICPDERFGAGENLSFPRAGSEAGATFTKLLPGLRLYRSSREHYGKCRSSAFSICIGSNPYGAAVLIHQLLAHP